MIYVWHHVATLLLAVAAAAGLTRGRWTHRSPRTAVLLWQATALSLLSASVGVLLSVGLAPYQRGIAPALGALAADLGRGRVPPGLGAGHGLAVAAGLALVGWAVLAQLSSSRQVWRQRARHRLLLRLVARPEPRQQALVLDHPVLTAYYLPGPAGCVVVSSGALAALPAEQLAAVLAHERAHARERHHLALAPFHAGRRALPCLLADRLTRHVELLVEMCADDRAAREHGAEPLVAALRRFGETGRVGTPPGALAAADRATELRIARLRSGPMPLRRPVRLCAVGVALAVAATPLSLFALPL
jgi:Zn-dependent protease with chaperone function